MSKTTPVLKKQVLFKDESPKPELPFQCIGRTRRYMAMRQLTAFWREETFTLNAFMIEEYLPRQFGFHRGRDYDGVEYHFRTVDGPLEGHENEKWYRNHTYRLVLSFKQQQPRLYNISPSGKIRDVSYMDVADSDAWWMVRNLDEILGGELRSRYPEMPENIKYWRGMLNWIRFQFVRDLPVPVLGVTSKFTSPNKSIKDVLDKMLGEYSRKSTRRAVMEFAQSRGEFNVPEVETRIRDFVEVAEAFDPSDWADVLAGPVIHPVPAEMLMEFSLPRRRRLISEEVGFGNYRVHDACRMWRNAQEEVDISDLSNWDDIHRRLTIATNDWMAMRQLERDEKLRQPIPQKKYGTIDNTKILDGALIIQTPKGAKDMMDWGRELSHCIGSYAMEAIEEESLFLALTNTDGLPVYTAMIHDGRMPQFRAKYNAKVPEEVTKAFVDELSRHKLVISGHPYDELHRYDELFG